MFRPRVCAFRVSMAAAVGVCTAVALCVWVVAAVVLLFEGLAVMFACVPRVCLVRPCVCCLLRFGLRPCPFVRDSVLLFGCVWICHGFGMNLRVVFGF